MTRHAKPSVEIATRAQVAGGNHSLSLGFAFALLTFGLLPRPICAEEAGLLTYSLRPEASGSLLMLAESLTVASFSTKVAYDSQLGAPPAARAEQIEWRPDLSLTLALKPTLPGRLQGPFRKLKLGFGQYFPGDSTARFRMNGAGQDDPMCLYFKVVFRF
jgi:hypothetical protein